MYTVHVWGVSTVSPSAEIVGQVGFVIKVYDIINPLAPSVNVWQQNYDLKKKKFGR